MVRSIRGFCAAKGPRKMQITIDLDDEAATALATIIRRLTPDDYADALTARGVDVKAWYRALDASRFNYRSRRQLQPQPTAANPGAARTLAGANLARCAGASQTCRWRSGSFRALRCVQASIRTNTKLTAFPDASGPELLTWTTDAGRWSTAPTVAASVLLDSVRSSSASGARNTKA